VEPCQVVPTIERIDVDPGRAGVEDRDAVVREPGWESRSFEKDDTAVDARRRAAQIALLASDLDRHRLPSCEMGADDDGVDPRTEVVDVRHADVLDAESAQRGERARRAYGLEQVAVARPVERRCAVRIPEELTCRR